MSQSEPNDGPPHREAGALGRGRYCSALFHASIIVVRGDLEVPPVAYDVIDPQPLLRFAGPGPARSFFSDRSTPVTLTVPCWRIIQV